MPHRRSPKAMRKRLAKRIIHKNSFRDPELAETVSLVNLIFADRIGRQSFTVHVERGEILADNRGRGTEQIMPEVKSRIE